ncbi:hypothetical protein B0H10DRAFT_2093155 [Mycena sp. CBHHK59/15]|nr:hypothetical protein B0H10DRAFT_2093155 [Mycena sp. CBHHK59/15]
MGFDTRGGFHPIIPQFMIQGWDFTQARARRVSTGELSLTRTSCTGTPVLVTLAWRMRGGIRTDPSSMANTSSSAKSSKGWTSSRAIEARGTGSRDPSAKVVIAQAGVMEAPRRRP